MSSDSIAHRVDDFFGQGGRVLCRSGGEVLSRGIFDTGYGLVRDVMVAEGCKAADSGAVACEAPAFGPVLAVAACVHPGKVALKLFKKVEVS